MTKRFMEALRITGRLGYKDIAARMQCELERLQDDTYKIAVAGEFKTGKSTLINRLFLKDDLLFTDIMEATAVPVEISYGAEKCLEVYPYASALSGEKDFSPENVSSIPVREGEPVRINDPTAEDIQAHTSAESPEGRARLAEKTARVKLYWPAPNLEGLTLFDTPGINSLNAAVISTTFRILPEADLLIFVTGAKQLSHTEREFLTSRIFLQGISRFMMIITWDSAADERDSQEKEGLRKSIQGQLAHLGYENIPVEFFDIRSLPDTVSAQTIRQRIGAEKAEIPHGKQAVDDVIARLLGNQEKESPEAGGRKAGGGTGYLEQKIISFIRDNVRPGRREKNARIFQQQLRLVLLRCNAELSSINKSETERRQMLSEIKTREAEVRLRHEVLNREFAEKLKQIKNRYLRNAEKGIRQFGEKRMEMFASCEGMPEIQKALKDAQHYLKKDMEETLLQCARTAGEELTEVIREYGMKSRVLLDPWQSEISRSLQIDGGILAKIPPFAMLTLDVMLFVRFGPFGPLADILIRLLVHYIPLLNKALPVSLAANLLKKKICSSLAACLEQIRKELPELLADKFDPMTERLLAEWREYTEMQLGAVRESAENILARPPDRERQVLLYEMQRKADILLGEI